MLQYTNVLNGAFTKLVRNFAYWVVLFLKRWHCQTFLLCRGQRTNCVKYLKVNDLKKCRINISIHFSIFSGLNSKVYVDMYIYWPPFLSHSPFFCLSPYLVSNFFNANTIIDFAVFVNFPKSTAIFLYIEQSIYVCSPFETLF